jgi:hypothetical protein
MLQASNLQSRDTTDARPAENPVARLKLLLVSVQSPFRFSFLSFPLLLHSFVLRAIGGHENNTSVMRVWRKLTLHGLTGSQPVALPATGASHRIGLLCIS